MSQRPPTRPTPLTSLHRVPRVWMRGSNWKPRATLWVGAITVGFVAASLALAVTYAINMFGYWRQLHPWLILLLPPLVLGLLTWLTRRYAPEASGSGIPQVIEVLDRLRSSADLRTRALSLPIACYKAVVCVAAFFGGASLGREGPTVQIGAALMNALGRFSGNSSLVFRRALIVAGGGAGLAAAFNAPLAGVVFTIEELARSFEERASGAVIAAVILAGVIGVFLLGHNTYFGHAVLGADDLKLGPHILAVAVGGGFLGGFFSRYVVSPAFEVPLLFARLRGRAPVLFAMGCGVVLSALGWVTDGQVFGTGYAEVRALLDGENLHAGFTSAKWLATLACYWSGIPGGIFSPVLSIGAGMGANFASWGIGPREADIVIGMAAVLAGVTQAPITAFVIVMEMVDSHALVLPLMVAALIASLVARTFSPPAYHALAALRSDLPPTTPSASPDESPADPPDESGANAAPGRTNNDAAPASTDTDTASASEAASSAVVEDDAERRV